eukprot:CAMPEP_0119319876 /NCGR_PEP_ID=MMETSP1333-20130426/50706_1 /TAXON_ID=418940 /ORGANISM="Scyphosphaera apsteinii, Strain RCC1455" /LENGTH=359 /DNA_ID=CAMNT_0007326411 /DNA_START=246 /DNA_END=1326 /DNA_ORIENTATION=-
MSELATIKKSRFSLVPADGVALDETPLETPVTTTAEYRRGLLTVGGITVLFASNSPAVHAVFSNAAVAPPVLLLNAAVSIVALTGLLFGGDLLASSTPLASTLSVTASRTIEKTSVQAGLELGLWKMLGTVANLFGLSLTSADHGAFLIQLTTLIVPVVQGASGVPIPRKVWCAIGLAICGIFLFTQDPDSSGASLRGDGLCVLAACLYATYDLRLFKWGKLVTPLPLITTKIFTQAALSVLLFLTVGAPTEGIRYISDVLASPDDLCLFGFVTLWCGIAVNAVAPFLQVGGQQAVGPARAQVLYASQPLWAALLSLALLDETVGPEGLAGGALFLAAVFLAATAPAPDANCKDEICEI